MGTVYEVRAQRLDQKKDGEMINKLTEKGSNLIVFFRGEYFHLFYLKGAYPKTANEEYWEFDTLLRIEEGPNMKNRVIENLGPIPLLPATEPLSPKNEESDAQQAPNKRKSESQDPFVDPLQDLNRKK